MIETQWKQDILPVVKDSGHLLDMHLEVLEAFETETGQLSTRLPLSHAGVESSSMHIYEVEAAMAQAGKLDTWDRLIRGGNNAEHEGSILLAEQLWEAADRLYAQHQPPVDSLKWWIPKRSCHWMAVWMVEVLRVVRPEGQWGLYTNDKHCVTHDALSGDVVDVVNQDTHTPAAGWRVDCSGVKGYQALRQRQDMVELTHKPLAA